MINQYLLRFLVYIRFFFKKLIFNNSFLYSYYILLLVFYIFVVFIMKIFFEIFQKKNSYNNFFKKVKSFEEKNFSFLKNMLSLKFKNFFSKIRIKKRKIFTIKILLKRRNLFLTLFNFKGKTLLKKNLGSSGFKKRQKFTGHSLESTSLEFFKAAKNILKKKKEEKKFKKIYIVIYFKNCLKNWQYRFIKKGIRKSWMLNASIRLYAMKNFSYKSHSKGLRLRKKRRV